MENEKLIISEYIDKSGVKYIFEYYDADSFGGLDKAKCKQTYGICFYENKMVIGYGGRKKDWGLIGGTIEKVVNGQSEVEEAEKELHDVTNELEIKILTEEELKTFTKKAEEIC